MKKNQLLKIVNVLIGLDFLLIVTAAILHDIFIPMGIYETIHVIPGFVFAGLIMIHVFLNRSWIKSQYFKKKN